MQFPSLYTRPTGTNAIAPRKSISSAVGRWKENIAPPFSPPIPIIPRLFSLCPAFPPGLYEVVPRSKLSKVFYSIGWKRESFFWFKSFPFTAKFSIPFGAMSFFLFFFFSLSSSVYLPKIFYSQVFVIRTLLMARFRRRAISQRQSKWSDEMEFIFASQT